MLPRAITTILIGLSIATPFQKAVDIHEPMVTIPGNTSEYGMKVTYKFPKTYMEHHRIYIMENRLVEDMGDHIYHITPVWSM